LIGCTPDEADRCPLKRTYFHGDGMSSTRALAKLALDHQKEIRMMDLQYKIARDGQKNHKKIYKFVVNNSTNCNDVVIVVFPSKTKQ
jgi:hypothetical protein